MPQTSIRYNPAADYYQVLGVSQSSSIDEIHRVYRARAKEVHPDTVHPSRKAWATQQFQRINEAHDILGDPASKAEYDKQRFLYLSAAFRKTPPPVSAARSGVRYRRKRSGVLFLIMIAIWVIGALAGISHGWDSSSDSPTMDVDNLVASMGAFVAPTSIPCDDPNTQITLPKVSDFVADPVVVQGTASGQDFAGYKVELRTPNSYPGNSWGLWKTLVEKTGPPVENGFLADLSSLAPVPSGNYTVRLTVKQKNGTIHQCDVDFFIVGEQ